LKVSNAEIFGSRRRHGRTKWLERQLGSTYKQFKASVKSWKGAWLAN
jgi:hypothetical protein